MAKVSLRSYNREIETMVDRGQLDEAIAHCRHILNTFPKNLETYRLLGKAYLEARRYNEATDIFERLLMAVPDDFVAHVGMSIIRDEQNELDEAIWHMERAFEVQPSNAAIQSELQRLFGRRDGIEPPKIRLNQGALAHMYVQGELYQQAIAEIKGVLEEDNNRQDMQVLLARAYFYAGQKSEAAEICSQLLRRYPYSFDANRVLVELLPETEQAESPQAARQRVNELDPYARFASGTVFQTDEVADAAVNLERLEWDGQPVDLGPEWRESLGIGRDEQPAPDEEPDWLKAGLASGSFDAAPSEETASVSSSDEDIPDFLREAGWGKDTGAFQEGSGIYATSDESTDEPELAEGDLPDWVKAMAPTDAGIADSSSQADTGEDLTQDDVPDWLQGLGDVQDVSRQEQPLEQGDLPDWLAAVKPAEESLPEPSPDVEPAAEDELPDWLQPLQAEEEETIAKAGEGEVEPETPQEPAVDFPEMAADSLADWQLGEEESAGPVDFDATDTGTLGTSAGEQDDAIAWLEGLAAKHGARPEELVTDPNARQETEPEWVRQARAAKDQGAGQEPVSEEESVAEPAEDLPDFLADMLSEPAEEAGPETAPVGDLGTSAEEQDDAIAWLESLAAKHGAKAEELVTDPEARKETAPEWVQKAAEVGSAAQEPVEAEQQAPTAGPSEEVPDWIEPAMDEEGSLSPELEDTQPNKAVPRTPADETGTWLSELEEEGENVRDRQPAAEMDSTATGADEDLPDWLREMQTGSQATEALVPSEGEAEEVPDWLSEVEGQPSTAEGTPPSEPEEQMVEGDVQDAPDWLSQAEGEPATSEAAVPSVEEAGEQEVPEWLRGVEAEPTEGEVAPATLGEEEISAQEPAPEPEAEAPDWLSAVESEQAGEESLPAFPLEEEPVSEPEQTGFRPQEAAAESDEPDLADWLKNVETEQAGEEAGDTSPEDASADDLPSWLAGLDEKETQQEEQPETPVASADEDLPEWLRGVEGQEPLPAEPTAPADWLPEDLEAPAEEETQPEPVMEQPVEPASEAEPAAPPESEPEEEPAMPERPAVPSQAQEPVFAEAQLELSRGNVSGALNNYEKLIRKGKLLDEIIYDLREALYRYPVDVSILQALGDAYMRANRLQDALDAYTKAEELLR